MNDSAAPLAESDALHAGTSPAAIPPPAAWEPYEGAILQAVRRAEACVEAPEDRGIERMEYALRRVLSFYERVHGRAADDAMTAWLEIGIEVVHRDLEMAGLIPPPSFVAHPDPFAFPISAVRRSACPSAAASVAEDEIAPGPRDGAVDGRVAASFAGRLEALARHCRRHGLTTDILPKMEWLTTRLETETTGTTETAAMPTTTETPPVARS